MSAVVRTFGYDIDGTAAKYVDGSLCFDPVLMSHFFANHHLWDKTIFITARYMSTSARDIVRCFFNDEDATSTTMTAAIAAIKSDIEKQSLDLDEADRPEMPEFTSVFDEDGGVKFLPEILIPFEKMVTDFVASAKNVDCTKDNASIAKVARLLRAVDKLKDKFVRQQIYRMLDKQLFSVELGETNLATRLETLKDALTSEQKSLLGFNDISTEEVAASFVGKKLETFYLRHHHSRYYQVHQETLYPNFKAYGKTPRLVEACHVVNPKVKNCHLALVDDSQTYIDRSFAGAKAYLEKGLLNVFVKPVQWALGYSKAEYDAELEFFKEPFPAPKPTKPQAAVSTVCFNLTSTMDKTPVATELTVVI